MKKLQAPFLLIALILLNVSVAFAGASGPPPPQNQTARNSSLDGETNAELDDDDDGPPVTPGIPLNENIVFLMIAGTALGITVLYKNKIKKASV